MVLCRGCNHFLLFRCKSKSRDDWVFCRERLTSERGRSISWGVKYRPSKVRSVWPLSQVKSTDRWRVNWRPSWSRRTCRCRECRVSLMRQGSNLTQFYCRDQPREQHSSRMSHTELRMLDYSVFWLRLRSMPILPSLPRTVDKVVSDAWTQILMERLLRLRQIERIQPQVLRRRLQAQKTMDLERSKVMIGSQRRPTRWLMTSETSAHLKCPRPSWIHCSRIWTRSGVLARRSRSLG